MKTIFVTGAEGFTGTHLVTHLTRRGYTVVGGVRNRARKLAFERRGGKAIVCDVSDAINVARAVASVKPDGIVHLACMARPSDANAEPLAAYQSIVSGCANLLDAVRRCVPRAKVLLVSACDVYGNAGSDGTPIPETTPVQPVSTFGSLKATAESVAQTFFFNYHLNITIARPFHYTGPGQSDRFFFPAVVREVLDFDPAIHGPALRLPDLDCRRDLMHIHDAIDAYMCLLEEGRPNETYNIATGRCWTVRQIVERIVQQTGKSVPIEPLDCESEGQIHTLCGDYSKMQREFDWQPMLGMERAVQDLVTAIKAERQPSASHC